MPNLTGFHHVTFTVTDLARSAAWYIRVLGLTKAWEMPDMEGRGRKIALLVPATDLRVVLVTHAKATGGVADEMNTGLDHLAFAVPGREELELWHAHFEALGIDHSPIKQGATGWLIAFRDPDNLQLEVYTLGNG
ncbi:MAG: VOC family protein [Chloroflexota bacterium]